MLKISVITVAFNAAQTIEKTLVSVASQTHPALEHIVIDGQSTDETLKVIARHGQHIAHLVSEPDKGIYDAMNKGLRIASGDVLCFLNADDFYASPSVISRVADEMEKSGLDALIGDVAFFHANRPERIARRYNSGTFSPERLSYGWMPAHTAFFLKHEIYNRAGPFKTDYRIAGDFEFIARVFSTMPIRYRHLPEILVHMQLGGISNAGVRSWFLSNVEIARACRENGLETSLWKLSLRYPKKLFELFRQ